MRRKAFTLVELLIAIAIIGLLGTISLAAFKSYGVKTRNTARKTNLTEVSKALELYYSANGSYPDTGGIANWRGNSHSYFGSYPDSGPSAWIPGLSPTYMVTLPHDPNTDKANSSSLKSECLDPGWSGYFYTSNGTDYKLLSHCAPEGTMSANDPFYDPNRPFWAWAIFTSGARGW